MYVVYILHIYGSIFFKKGSFGYKRSEFRMKVVAWVGALIVNKEASYQNHIEALNKILFANRITEPL